MRLKDLRACYELAKKLEVSPLACKDVGGRSELEKVVVTMTPCKVEDSSGLGI